MRELYARLEHAVSTDSGAGRVDRQRLVAVPTMRIMRQPIPVRPDFTAHGRPADAIVRAVVAHAHAFLARCSPEDSAARLYGDDRAVEMICRAAVAPANTTTAAWAGTLAQSATLDLISTLGPVSAASQLIARSLQVEFGSNYQVYVP